MGFRPQIPSFLASTWLSQVMIILATELRKRLLRDAVFRIWIAIFRRVSLHEYSRSFSPYSPGCLLTLLVIRYSFILVHSTYSGSIKAV
ncbi:uncharacterized protein EV420DRAFT_1576288 [Desarmillaria tabescens]|uniref:Uncharacterized protein n=1 Tax=Armillaria tabescens TaxID=1929756 RepID=A0AA39JIJ4_ARMTA|nr:uncharacterized protein EV420DRAFT_1576288 [Desarmillaria tabescens]KAK0443421.1 hypothetical protein EV420DRAFT_1576288 [Desarmillaria tabescens]